MEHTLNKALFTILPNLMVFEGKKFVLHNCAPGIFRRETFLIIKHRSRINLTKDDLVRTTLRVKFCMCFCDNNL